MHACFGTDLGCITLIGKKYERNQTEDQLDTSGG
jgi:hypothetical protein